MSHPHSKLGGYLLVGLMGLLCVGYALGQAPETIELSGVVRDFKRAHPDFNVVPIGGPGHYAANIGRDVGDGDRPVFVSGGFKVAAQWTNSGSQPIPPHLFAEPLSPGELHVGEGATVNPLATFDTWDSSAGPYGPPDNAGPAPGVNVGAPMPVILVPTNLGPSLGNMTLNNTTISSDMHCDDLTLKGTVLIDGNCTILCEGQFTLATNADVELMPGAKLTMYVRGGTMILPRTTLNAPTNTGLPGLVTIYNLGEDEVRISQPGAVVYAMIISPNAPMRVMPEAGFFGYFIGELLDVQPLGGFHLDTSLVAPLLDACGAVIDDVPGAIATFSAGGITSADTYDQWYGDELGVNLAKEHSITLTRNASGIYEYLDGEFYPVDGLIYGNQGDLHNYYFTYEIEAEFTYQACAGQFVEFAGADDCWIFIDGYLGIDLGGIMPGTEQVLELDRLGLADGKIYELHLFFAHRESTEAAFNLRTNLELWNDQVTVTVSLPCD